MRISLLGAMKILVVEDDLATQTLLADILTACYYQVEVTSDGRAALDLALEFAYDTIVLDINIPGLDGISLCRQLRLEGCETPILLLTAKDAIADRIIGLDAGADDYAIKPFNLSELSARIRALLRRGRTTPTRGVVTWEWLQLNYENAEVRYGDRVLRLTPKEYGILELLLSNPHRIFSRSVLLARLWELETAPTESVINSHIKSIRQKLKAAGATEDPIETVYGFGYRLRRLDNSVPIDESEIQRQSKAEVDRIVLDLWVQFQDSFHEQIDFLAATAGRFNTAALVANRAETIEPSALAAAKQVAHKLVGSLGVYGFPRGSILASQIETLLNCQRELTATDRQQLQQSISELQREISSEPVFGTAAVPHAAITAEIDRQLPPLVGTILAIDDDLAILQQLDTILSPWGLQVIPVRDRARFWELLKETTPDLLILDLDMPEFRGIELCQTVRNDPQWDNLPILAIAASPAPTTILQTFAAGGDDFVRKPILASELIARVLNLLQPRQLRQQYLTSYEWNADD